MSRPDTRVRIAFDLAAGGAGNFFTLDDPSKGELDNATFKLAGDILEDVTNEVRSITVRRGRSRELERYQAGAATVNLDNKDRKYDPAAGTAVTPFGASMRPRKALESLMDNLANSLNRTSTITVTTVNRVITESVRATPRAKGGPVSPSELYLVGEKGPEFFVPNTAGNIIPNDKITSMSGRGGNGNGAAATGSTVINLNVNAGMGTQGAEVGRQIVDALKAYERRNGSVYVSA